MKKLEYITILRALAILAVLMIHTSQYTLRINDDLPPFADAIIYNGTMGVQLFYLLSAFTLFLSFSQRGNEKKAIRNYFIRRFFRIAPLYYIAIFYYLWQIRYFAGDNPTISAANIVSNFAFLHGFSPYWINAIVPGGWSVGVEMTFYCLLPILFMLIKNSRQAWYFTLVALALRYVLLYYFRNHPLIDDHRLWSQYLFYYLPGQLPIFSLGIVCYFMIYERDKPQLSSKHFFWGFCIIGICLAVKADMIFSPLFNFGLAFLLLVLATEHYHPRMLFNPVFKFIGQISYTIYLTHFAALHLLIKLQALNLLNGVGWAITLANFLVNYFLILLVSVLFSSVLYYLIELPMQRVGSRIIKVMP